MDNQWLQGAAVGLIVLGAIAYLLRKYLPRSKKTAESKNGCSSCGGCSGRCH